MFGVGGSVESDSPTEYVNLGSLVLPRTNLYVALLSVKGEIGHIHRTRSLQSCKRFFILQIKCNFVDVLKQLSYNKKIEAILAVNAVFGSYKNPRNHCWVEDLGGVDQKNYPIFTQSLKICVLN